LLKKIKKKKSCGEGVIDSAISDPHLSGVSSILGSFNFLT
jgi:hypothetical protein